MKFLVAVALFCAFVCTVFASDELVLDQDIIDAVNADKNSGWTAGKNKVFEGKTMSQIKHFMGTFLIDKETNTLPKVSFQVDNAPDSFNSETNWPNCKHPIRNQGQCGSCWAFSASSVMSDRFCIASQGKTNTILSPQDMVSCDTGDYGCQGGILQNLWQYLENTGVVTDTCFPYQSGSGAVPACRASCVTSEKYTKYKVKDGSTQQLADVASAQADLMANGPFQVGFKVYRDFFSYKSGVYRHVSGSFAGGHAVVVVGWGVDSSSKQAYWIVKNSWGPDWGLNGYFWILRGKNECDLESNMFSGLPAV